MVNDVLEVKAFCDNRNVMCIVNLWGVSVGEKRREELNPLVYVCVVRVMIRVVWLYGYVVYA